MSFTYPFARPSVAVDCVVFTYLEPQLKVLLIERRSDPFKGCWALPGGFVDIDESTDMAAGRELSEETGLTMINLRQVQAFSEVDRDPRDRVISVAYFGFVSSADSTVQPGSDAMRAEWFNVKQLPELAFDHARILQTALRKIRELLQLHPVGFEFLEDVFTLTQLRILYQTILGREHAQEDFNQRMQGLNFLDKAIGESDVSNVSADRRYRVNQQRLEQLQSIGIGYWI